MALFFSTILCPLDASASGEQLNLGRLQGQRRFRDSYRYDLRVEAVSVKDLKETAGADYFRTSKVGF